MNANSQFTSAAVTMHTPPTGNSSPRPDSHSETAFASSQSGASFTKSEFGCRCRERGLPSAPLGPVLQQTKPSIRGFLQRKGRYSGRFKPTYYELRGNVLLVLKGGFSMTRLKASNAWSEQISLCGAEAAVASGASKGRYPLTMRLPANALGHVRTLQLAADDADKRDAWIAQLNSARASITADDLQLMATLGEGAALSN
jgi:PH domain